MTTDIFTQLRDILPALEAYDTPETPCELLIYDIMNVIDDDDNNCDFSDDGIEYAENLLDAALDLLGR
jgi:hypothetical protein